MPPGEDEETDASPSSIKPSVLGTDCIRLPATGLCWSTGKKSQSFFRRIQFSHRLPESSKAGMQRILRRRQGPVFWSIESLRQQRARPKKPYRKQPRCDDTLAYFSSCRLATEASPQPPCLARWEVSRPVEPNQACSETRPLRRLGPVQSHFSPRNSINQQESRCRDSHTGSLVYWHTS